MWPNLIEKSKEGGADVIETYVFWNGHEPVKGEVTENCPGLTYTSWMMKMNK